MSQQVDGTSFRLSYIGYTWDQLWLILLFYVEGT
jgi:hypothetical protein